MKDILTDLARTTLTINWTGDYLADAAVASAVQRAEERIREEQLAGAPAWIGVTELAKAVAVVEGMQAWRLGADIPMPHDAQEFTRAIEALLTVPRATIEAAK